MKKIGKLKLIALFTFLSIALVLVGVNFLEADKPDKPGKGKPKVAFYRIYLTPIGADSMATDTGCNGWDYVLAEWDDAHNYLHANGTLIDIDQNKRIPLLMRLSTFPDVGWTRNYDAGRGLVGTFNGCYGETDGDHGYHGALFITIGKKKGQSIIRFTWYFGYYTSSSVREHFALFSEDISFPVWKGEDISIPVTGWFDLQYYLNDPDTFPSYESFTDGVGRTFDFNLTINKITQ
jgi:hypothetical protein